MRSSAFITRAYQVIAVSTDYVIGPFIREKISRGLLEIDRLHESVRVSNKSRLIFSGLNGPNM